jgi:S1/P1 Nuclease
MKILRLAIFVFWCLVSTPTLFGWGEVGHKVVASIAFRQLDAAKQAKIVALLKNHPRFSKDFADLMPDDVSSGSESVQDEWIFQQAAEWPDIARDFRGDDRKKYHRPEWHFINNPLFLTSADEQAMADSIDVNLALDPPNTPNEKMNAVQVLRFARKAMSNSSVTPDQKAIWLCWIFHDVGDVHQPLHCVALFARELLPQGDRGGNRDPTVQGKNLHSLWDKFPGPSGSFDKCKRKAIVITHDSDLSWLGRQAAADLDEESWVDESVKIANESVYDSEVLAHLRGFQHDSIDDVPPLRLSDEYLSNGGDICERRVTEAGYRLGAILKQIADAH